MSVIAGVKNHGESMIITLKIELFFGGFSEEFEECIRIVEIESSSNLEDLHFLIQDAVNFDNDHLYEFYLAASERSRNKYRFDDENGGLYSVTLEELFPLPKNRKLFYLFDYGDCWQFRVTRTLAKPKIKEPGLKYPRVVKEIGSNPVQYPEYED